MDKQKLAIIILVIAIIISVVNIVVAMGVDFGDFQAIGSNCADRVNCVGGMESDSGQVSFTITQTPGGTS